MTQTQKILKLLKEAPNNTATNEELNKICYRYGARLHDLRNAGHNIISKQVRKGLWAFTLEGAGR